MRDDKRRAAEIQPGDDPAVLGRLIGRMGAAADPETAALIRALWVDGPSQTADDPAAAASTLLDRLGPARTGWESTRVQRARRALRTLVDPATLGGLVEPALLAAATPLALTFGGQGAHYLDELAALTRQSASAAHLVATVVARIRGMLADLPATERVHYPYGLDVAAWIQEPADRPPAAYLAQSNISQPLIFACQVAHFLRLLELGYDRPAFRRGVVAAGGHSQGVMAALFVAETWQHADPAPRAADYARYLFLQGYHMHRAADIAAPSPRVVATAREAGAGMPSPMAAIAGLTLPELQDLADTTGLPLTITLHNTRTRHIVSGRADHLEALREAIVADSDAMRRARAAGRHAGRLPAPGWEYLPVSAPYHTESMAPALAAMRRDVRLQIDAGDLAFPVFDTATATPLTGKVIDRLLRMQFVEPVRWTSIVRALYDRGARCLLDFGPGDGVMRLAAANLRGRGVAVVPCALPGGREAALDTERAPAPRTPAYATHAPRRTPDGRLDNRFVRWTGMPPHILPGMTPTTADAPIVAAAANAGYVAELAGGGQVTEAVLRERLDELVELLEPGVGIVFNALFMDPYLWSLHFGADPLVIRLRDEGYPIIGVTVSAGLPEVPDAVALLDRLAASGIWLNAFKPGSDRQIRHVLAIADAAPQHTILVQVEGGRAGGHHSWEDLDELLLAHYDDLRRRPNVVLAVGGGVGTPERATALLSGAWSEETWGLAPMPVDAVFMGTLFMAAREARTSDAVKAALVAAPGVDAPVLDSSVAGGVTSGRSGLDAPIHYLDNRAARVARQLDLVAGDGDAIAAAHDEIAAALATTAKPWFGAAASMSWPAVLRRFVALCALGRGGRYEDGRWLDRTFRVKFEELLRRAEARLAPTGVRSLVQSALDLGEPEALIDALEALGGASSRDPIGAGDAAFFEATCRRPGKPVPFVASLDANTRRSFKSDSLWQSHDDRFEAEEVLVIPGPTAVAAITCADEPTASILDRFAAHAAAHAEPTDEAPAGPAPRIAVCTRTRRVFAAPSVERVESDGHALELGLEERDGVLWWDRAAYLTNQRAFYGALFARAEPLSMSAYRAATGDDTHGAPLSAAFALAWREIFDALCAEPTDLLRLVHESNDIRAGEAWPPAEGQPLVVEAARTAALPLAGGLRVETRAELRTAEGAAVATIISRFFIRGDRTQEHARRGGPRRWSLTLRTEAERDFLTAQPWLSLESTLLPGDRLELLGEDVSVDGATHRARGTLLRDGVRVGSVALDADGVRANPVEVVADLLAAPDDRVALDRPRLLGSLRLTAPADLGAFATASGDRNPIHTDAAVARFAGLQGPIVHGMWTAAAAIHRAVRVAAEGDATRVRRTDVRFTDIVHPGEELVVEVEQTALRGGGPIVAVRVRALREGEPVVLTGTLEFSPPTTAYAFPGQGIQSAEMGMAGMGRSRAARAVWEEAERVCQDAFGFSLLRVVRENPPSLVIGGERLVHPKGVLHLTQLTQVAMVVMASAQVAELRERGLFVDDALFCGHSVGEYAALTAVAGVLPLEASVRIVYHRGLTMHALVQRDGDGRSGYAMGVIRPHLCGLDEAGALALVDAVRAELPDRTLDVVNFNVRGRQYSVTGHADALEAVARHIEARADGRPAWLWVPGIDVPFHSPVLRHGVDRFREALEAYLQTDGLPWTELVGRYVPNLVARPFEVTPEFARAVVDASGSARVAALLEDWPAAPDQAARTLLVELLAYQFASPVRWIETQDHLMDRVSRFVEIGVAHQPTVANMMRSTLRGQPARDRMEVLNSEADLDRLVGPPEDVEPVEAIEPGVEAAPTPAESTATAAAVAVAPSAPSPGAALPALEVRAGDAIRCLCALQARVRLDQLDAGETADELLGGNSARRNQLLADLGAELACSIDGAHELPLAALATEAEQRAASYAGHGRYLAGAIDAALARGLGAARLDRQAAAAYLSSEWGLSGGQTFVILNRVALHARHGDSTRGGPLSELPPSNIADAAAGKAWLDTVVTATGRELGVADVTKPGAMAGAAATSVDARALTELEERLEARLRDAGAVLSAAPNGGRAVETPTPDRQAERLALYEAEHGDGYEALIAPRFDADQHVAFTTLRAWRRRDRAVAALRGEPGPAAPDGHDFRGRTALVTGAGPGSIALALCRLLLQGGARVIVTTSRYSTARVRTFKRLYQACASEGAELHVVGFNQGSIQDTDALIAWACERWAPDLLVPFAAIGEVSDLFGMGGRSLAVLRILLLGVERLVARLAERTSGCHVLLPLSPNHGIFGGDGAYAEAKAGLETMLAKWHHEPWGRRVGLVGARIGWVRGTGLMEHNDDVARELEGVRTFSTEEMAQLLADLATDEVRRQAAERPIAADLTGGLAEATDLAAQTAAIRARRTAAQRRSQERARLDAALEERVRPPAQPDRVIDPTPLARVEAPIPTPAELAELPELDHLDPARLVAIVGYGEVGPWGSHRTRWAAEKGLSLSLEAVAELAWTMGLIAPAPGGGWIDAESGAEIDDELSLGERYEARILAHSGIRVFDAELQGFDPRSALGWADVHLDQDFVVPVRSMEEAETLRAGDPERTEVRRGDDGSLHVVRRAGAVLKVRSALRLDRWIAGQLPAGWEARRYGVPGELVEQVDRTTLFLLIATAEAFVQAGLEPEEMYGFLHPARVACTASSGIGGMRKLARLYQDFELGAERQGDGLQETLINVIAGWVVQSYLGSYGAMSIPVGACATAAVSVAEGAAKILSDNADFVVCGGVDDLGKEGLIGFQDMAATASTAAMGARGIEPGGVSRPNDRRRGGFVEAQGGGVQLLCRASLALEAGLPCYGLVAYADSFADGLNRSIPAPGLGPVAAVSEAGDRWAADPGGACDLVGRRARIQTMASRQAELADLVGPLEAARLVDDARRAHGHDFWRGRQDTAPLRGALAVFGLGADDIAVVSKHDTSTAANDPNEARIHQVIQDALGRSPDRPALVVSQKSLTGHSKGGAAAWQINGVLQIMADGVIPGNRNLEDVDDAMADLSHLAFNDAPVEVPRARVRAALVTSLGFGHVSGLVALVHPFLLWRALSAERRERWAERTRRRLHGATRRLRSVLSGREPLVRLRTDRPFVGAPGTEQHVDHELSVLTDASARLPQGATTYPDDRREHV